MKQLPHMRANSLMKMCGSQAVGLYFHKKKSINQSKQNSNQFKSNQSNKQLTGQPNKHTYIHQEENISNSQGISFNFK